MYQGVKALTHSNVQWYYYEPSDRSSIVIQTHSETALIEEQHGTPRVYVENRDITDAPGTSLIWNYNGRYQLKLGTTNLEGTLHPPT